VWRVLVIAGVVLVTSIALYLQTAMTLHGAPASFFGVPVINAHPHDTAWISVAGSGGIVLLSGFGLVTFGWFGVGALFAVGQACAGGIAIGQVALGGTFVVAQLGLGAAGVVQAGAGGAMRGQAALAKDGREMFAALDDWLGRALRLP
jgi:hypothetical protein